MTNESIHRAARREFSTARLGAFALIFAGALLATGCVSPGNARGPLSIEGRLVNAAGEPLPGVRVEVLLPKVYGLRAEEVGAGQAMDFTSPRRLLQLVTDRDGSFRGDLGEQVYAVDRWVFPPLGAVPPAPPAPALLVRTPDLSDENYYVCSEKGACVVMRPDGSRIPAGQSLLVRSHAAARTVPGPATGTEAAFEIAFDVPAGLQVTAALPSGR